MTPKEDRAVGRALPEWIGKTPDTPIPPRVRLRVFERYGGRCYLSGRLIRPGDQWEAEHVLAISLGGENRERNLAPALKAPHAIKTKADVKAKAKIARVRQKHLGIKSPKGRKLQGRGFSAWRRFSGEIVRRAER